MKCKVDPKFVKGVNVLPKTCSNTNIQIQTYKYKCTNMKIQIRIYKYKCLNMQIQISNFKYEAAMKCKVDPKFVKGGNVVLPYRWSLMEHMSKLHQLAPQPTHGQISKYLNTRSVLLAGGPTVRLLALQDCSTPSGTQAV